ncbi:ABC-type transport auxiliary lipoprotein family protein [Legionella lytica]|uniref:ABC-type transport auxiliary lipoprotein family protein n=1 Tax=Legionella lytica TaxID=96232 RepID=A0ABW8D379_9GAMM
MRRLNRIGLCLICLLLVACSPVKIPASNQYQLTAYSSKQLTKHPQRVALWVTPPDAAAGYQSEQMLYVNKPFQLESFVKNAWSNPPADMLYPLMVQSLQKTGVFHAVLSSSYSQGADYRLDTQLLSLEQSFLRRPSVLQFSAKVVLTRVSDNKVMGSKIISLQIPCSVDNPYGGVVAANQATREFTARMSAFVVSHL